MYDVGVDWNNFAPIKWQVVRDKIKRQIEMDMNFIELDDYDSSSNLRKFFLKLRKKIVKLVRRFVIL